MSVSATEAPMVGVSTSKVAANSTLLAKLVRIFGSRARLLGFASACAAVLALLLVRLRRNMYARAVRGRVAALYMYPVKSLEGSRVPTATVESRGFQHDRRWLIVDKNDVFITQRRFAQMALLRATVINSCVLKLDKRESGLQTVIDSLEVPLTVRGPKRTISIWEKSVEGAIDQGDEAAHWLQSAIGVQGLRLVYMSDECVRPVSTEHGNRPGTVSFADGYPFLLTSVESLAELNRRIAEKGEGSPVGMERFRPNVVVEGLPQPFAEDEFGRLNFSAKGSSQGRQNVRFKQTNGCARCILTTADPSVGKLGGLQKEPLVSLRDFRAGEGLKADEVYFGINLVLENRPTDAWPMIAEGDELRVSESCERLF
jgi:uncharacterized protein YcbX